MTSLGRGLEARLDQIERVASARPLASLALGVLLGLASLIGGLLTFLIVWAVLVGIVR